MDVCALTHIGKVRAENQDSVYQQVTEDMALLIVADGMGGHAGGSLASSMTVEAVTQQLQQGKTLRQAILHANAKLLEEAEAKAEYDGMGTTLTIARIQGGQVEFAQVGDSRGYILQQGKLRQVTKDHSYVQYLVDMGKMTAKEAKESPYRNMITRSVGMPKLKVDMYKRPLFGGETVLLCSDGLYGYFEEEELEQYLLQNTSAKQKAQQLLQLALERGGEDNISVVIAILKKEGGEQHA